jgi:hypothetical protein
MHNNALGPEICGEPANRRNDFYRETHVDDSGRLRDDPPGCWRYDPSVEGRYRLYKASMERLLNPQQRPPKITKVSEDIIIEVGPRLWDGEEEQQLVGLKLRIPAGTNAGAIGNFLYKEFLVDLILAKVNEKKLRQRLEPRLGESDSTALIAELRATADRVISDPASFLDVLKRQPQLLDRYSSCGATVENAGHDFGGELPAADKQALIAFLATL